MRISIPKPASPRIALGPSRDEIATTWGPPTLAGGPKFANRSFTAPLALKPPDTGLNDTPIGHRLRED